LINTHIYSTPTFPQSAELFSSHSVRIWSSW